MKKLFTLLCFFLCLNYGAKAQYVTIPDPQFVSYLQAHFPTCMNGNQMDTTCAGIISFTYMNCQNNSISDLTGIQYFDNLQTLYCGVNQLTNLPTLPNGLIYLSCPSNLLISLPTLPNNLQTLYCSYNQLANLPTLPNSLQNLGCDGNQLASLPTLPSSLLSLGCGTNSITSLPTLPNQLHSLYCSGCNQLASLPPLPDSLQILYCYSDQLTSLPALPNSLQTLVCAQNQITNLPALPNSLQTLNCNYNQITSLPSLPNTLTTLLCGANNISCFPIFPSSLTNPSNFYFSIAQNPFTCLPNYVPAMSSYYLAFPLCLVGDLINNPNGCGGAVGILGSTYEDMNLNCFYDTGDSTLQNIKEQLYDSAGTLISQTFSAYNGVYDFPESVGTYTVRIDTAGGVPYIVQCVHPGIDSITTLTASVPLATNVNFSITCKPGFDVGVKSVVSVGSLSPGHQHQLKINGGDMSHWYGLNCGEGVAGQVVVTVIGPVTFSGIIAGALTPSIAGNIYTYNISNFGTVNNYTDFGLYFIVNANATVGSTVCVNVSVTPILLDNNSSNNNYNYCYYVSRPYDPNYKEAYPEEVQEGFNDYFTYTVHFQNTGSAAAININLQDTLDANLDLNTFQVINYSHYCTSLLSGNRLSFNFSNIQLPDSTSNLNGSQGFVQYRIKPIAGLICGSQIHNRASIYFDYNAPILTNTTVNSIVPPVLDAIVSPSTTVCAGTAVTLNGIGATVYNWSNGISDGVSFVPTTTTTYTVTGTFGNCTSTTTKTITVNPSYTSNVSATICQGDTYTFPDNTTATTTTVHTSHFSTVNACDSVVVTILNVNNSSTFTINQTSLNSYTLNSQTYNSSGTYTQILTNANGCDSILTLNLIIINPTTFQRFYTADSTTIFNDLVVTSDGGYVIGGTVGNDPSDYLITKLNINGIPQWSKKMGTALGNEKALRIGKSVNGGGYYLLGITTANVSTGQLNLVRLDTAGTVIWNKVITDASISFYTWIFGNPVPASIRETPTGDYIVSATTSDNYSMLIKVDSNGSLVWSRKYKTNTYTYSEAYFDVETTVDGGYITVGGGRGLSIIKTNSLGNVVWTKSYLDTLFIYGGVVREWGLCIKKTSDGGFIIGGAKTTESVDFYVNASLIKIDNNGNIQWSKSAGYSGVYGTGVHDVQQTADGGYLLNYYFTNSYYNAHHGPAVSKFSPSGTIQWSKNYTQYHDFNSNLINYFKLTPDGGFILNANPHVIKKFGCLIKANSIGTSGCFESNFTYTSSDIKLKDSSIVIDLPETVILNDIVFTTSNKPMTVGQSCYAPSMLLPVVTSGTTFCSSDTVIVRGTNLLNPIQVTIGSVPVVSIVSSTDTCIVAVIIQGSSGIINVTNVWGASTGTAIMNVISYSFVTNQSICAGNVFNWLGNSYSVSGTYSVNYITQNGCDSTYRLNLTVNPNDTIVINQSACNSYTLNSQTYLASGTYTQTLINANGCDSVVTLNLVINHPDSTTINHTSCNSFTLNSQTYNSSGTYTQILTNFNGCDSVLTLNLLINPNSTSNVSAAICQGDTYTFPDNSTATTATVNTSHFSTINSCDSTIVTTLTVNPTFTSNVSAAICQGDTYTFPDNTTSSTDMVNTSHFSTVNTCDSTIVTTLTVNPIFTSNVSATICQDGTYTFPDNTTSTTATVNTSHFSTVNTCDSTIVTTLTVNPIFTSNVSATICQDGTYTFPDNTTSTIATVNTSHFSTVNTCDSAIVTILTVNPTFTSNVSAAICQGDTYTFPDNTTSSTDMVNTSHFSTVNSCDSVIVTTLTVNPTYTSNVSATICQDGTYTFPDNTTSTTATVNTSHFSTINLCDSIIVTTLNVNPTYTSNVSATICQGDTYTFPDNTTATTAMVNTSHYSTVNACDSVIVTTLTVNPTFTSNVSAAICQGDIYTFPDNTTSTTAMVNTSHFSTINSCDSSIVTTLTLNLIYTSNVSATICQGDTYTFPDNTTATTAMVNTSHYSTVNSCDSVIVTTLTVNPIYTSNVSATICQGDTYTFPDNTTATTAMVNTSHYSTVNSCDSVIVTTLTVNPIFTSNVSATICQGDTYTFPDNTTSATAMVNTSHFSTLNTCDSTIVTTLTVNPIFTSNVSATICQGDTYTFPDNTTATTATVNTSHFNTVNTCDSLVITNLSVISPNTNITLQIPTCSCPSLLVVDSMATSYQWLDCNNGYSLISGETNNTYYVLNDGNYAVIVNQDGCIDTSACYYVIATGFSNVNYSSNIIISPNPFNAQLTISFGEEQKNTTIKVMNMLGECIQQQTTNKQQLTMDLSGFANGVYFVRIQDEHNNIVNRKVVKQ